MKLTILACAPDSKPLVRIYPVAKVLQRRHEMEIVGSYRSEELFSRCRDEVESGGYRYGTTLDCVVKIWPQMLRAVSGEVTCAAKPRLTTYGLVRE